MVVLAAILAVLQLPKQPLVAAVVVGVVVCWWR